MHIVRLMNSYQKRSKKNDDESAVAMLKKDELHDRTVKPVVCRDTRLDSILEDKELMKMHVDLQKRFPIYHVCPKCLAALLCGAAI